MSQSDETSPHRLFAAIVLMGSSLAVGCGGMAEGERQVGASGGPSGSTQGGSSSIGGSTGSGASVSSGTAGTPPDISINIGGVPPMPSAVTPGPFACPPQQWSCSTRQCGQVDNGWALEEGCDCDRERPLTASDCEPGEVFVCLDATSTTDGRPLTEHVLLSCACTPKSMYNCRDECDVVYGGDLSCGGSEDQLSATCGCALVYLK
jgi:hypothetical protein